MSTADDLSVCADKLAGRTFDVLWNGSNQFAVYFQFHADGTMNSNQTMFDNAPWRAVSRSTFEVGRKNGSFVLWEFKDATGLEAFRTDRKLFGLRLKRDYKSRKDKDSSSVASGSVPTTCSQTKAT